MSADAQQYTVRRPRYEALDRDSCVVSLELPHGGSFADEVQLVDFSRHGVQLRRASPLEPDSSVIVRIQDTSAGLDIALPGRIRWQQRYDDGYWHAGCIFDEPVGYETMGELFLSGVLDTGERG